MKDFFTECGLAVIFLVIFIIFLVVELDKNYSIPAIDATDAIVGEASNQDYSTMLCIAHALRNRKTLSGVYGYHAVHNAKESRRTWVNASLAWAESKDSGDMTNGATEFRSIDDQQPSHMKLTAVCGDFLFYKN